MVATGGYPGGFGGGRRGSSSYGELYGQCSATIKYLSHGCQRGFGVCVAPASKLRRVRPGTQHRLAFDDVTILT
jgi:hypothetical protein